MFGLRGLRPDLEITGFETAFSEIAPRLVKRGHHVTIYCRSSAHSAARRVPAEDGIELVYMPAPGGKNFSAVASTGIAVLHALVTRKFDVWFFVNVGMGHHAALARLSGSPVVMNVDGLDWQRGKWGPVGRAYFQSAARSAVRYCTRLVTDAEAMRAYYRDNFGVDSEMIAYGAELKVAEHPELLVALDLAPREYFLIVSRLIPENSLEAMLEGFRRSTTKKSLVVVGGANYRDAFHGRLRDIAAADERIRLVGHVADQVLLTELWCNCYAYLHGHSVGGTNPALLRAMGCGSCVLARDTVFNREVLGDTGLFFAHDADAVRALVDHIDGAPEEAEELRDLAPRRILEHYTWDQIATAYDGLFQSVAAGRASPGP
ncbi:MAG TPA: glycosyltransferase [Gemmatimonadaceae bacterium]|nr:glycosyltransferase [Gemmatimonadaceae bacterium]